MDAEILITSLHGEESALNADAGKSTRIAQRVNNAKKAMEDRTCVGVIAQKDSSNEPAGPRKKDLPLWQPYFPVSMPVGHESWIVDWFYVTDVWPEKRETTKQKAVTMWMVRLQKVHLGVTSYWAEPGYYAPPIQNRNYHTKAVLSRCTICQQGSPTMFDEGWMCRNLDCEGFWKLGTSTPKINELKYSETWLQQREWFDAKATNPFYPDFDVWHQANWVLPQQRMLDVPTVNQLCKDLLQGFCCPICRLVNRRVAWRRWACKNPNCSYTREGYPPRLPIARITTFAATPLPNFQDLPGFETSTNESGFTVYHYVLLDDCKVSYWMPNQGTNQQQRGSDFWFDTMCDLAHNERINLRRLKTKSKSISSR